MPKPPVKRLSVAVTCSQQDTLFLMATRFQLVEGEEISQALTALRLHVADFWSQKRIQQSFQRYFPSLLHQSGMPV